MSEPRPPDLRRQPGPHVFVDNLDAPTLAAEDHHHLAKSLRVRNGDPFTMSDGRGSWRTATFGDVVSDLGRVHIVPPPAYQLGIGIALTKASKPEFVVQKATELGLDRIIVFAGAHSVARWDETKRAKNHERLSRVAREAAMQSRRVTIPVIEVMGSIDGWAAAAQPVRADFGGVPVNAKHRLVLIGPEGGWSSAEEAAIPETVDLGPSVLRAETAAVVAAAFLARYRADLS